MERAFALGATIALLLQIVENIFPRTKSFLPMGQNGFVQSAGVILGAVAIYVLFREVKEMREKGRPDAEAKKGDKK